MKLMLDHFTVQGFVKILVTCLSPTNNITLHINVLTVDPTSIQFYPETPSTSGDPQFSDSTSDKEREFFIILLDRNMEVSAS